MLTDMFVLQDVLLSFEATLRIEYTENDVSHIIKDAKRRLEAAYSCRLDKPVYTVQAQSELVSDSLEDFLRQVAECLKQLTAITSIALFTSKPPINLADVNYLGFKIGRAHV